MKKILLFLPAFYQRIEEIFLNENNTQMTDVKKDSVSIGMLGTFIA